MKCGLLNYSKFEKHREENIDSGRGYKLHERVKEYVCENGIRHPQAYAGLIEKGLSSRSDG